MAEKIFEKEKKRIKSINKEENMKGFKSNYMQIIDKIGDNVETFHFETVEQAHIATKLVFDYCNENGYEYSHICCGGRGHLIKKKELSKIVITI